MYSSLYSSYYYVYMESKLHKQPSYIRSSLIYCQENGVFLFQCYILSQWNQFGGFSNDALRKYFIIIDLKMSGPIL